MKHVKTQAKYFGMDAATYRKAVEEEEAALRTRGVKNKFNFQLFIKTMKIKKKTGALKISFFLLIAAAFLFYFYFFLSYK